MSLSTHFLKSSTLLLWWHIPSYKVESILLIEIAKMKTKGVKLLICTFWYLEVVWHQFSHHTWQLLCLHASTSKCCHIQKNRRKLREGKCRLWVLYILPPWLWLCCFIFKQKLQYATTKWRWSRCWLMVWWWRKFDNHIMRGHSVNYLVQESMTSAKLMSYSSHVTLCPGWSMEGFKCLNQGHLNV